MPSGTAPPSRSPESLAAQVFAGLVSDEATSLREEKSPARPKPERPEGGPPRPPTRARIIAAGAAASLVLGIVIYLATDNGRIRIEIDDPKAVVQVDGKEVLIEGLGEPITLRAGEHNYLVRWGNGEFQTDRFVVRRGDNEALKVVYEPKGKGIDRAPRDRTDVAASKPPVPASDVGGFKSLFNGKDLTGWVTPEDKDLFTVEDGVILGKTDGKLAKNEYLVTDRPYNDFVLKARVKLRSGNSGIQFRSKRAADGAVSGPQADIGNGYWGWFYEELGRGVLERIPDEQAAAMVHEGEWNDFVIEATGDRVAISLNGLLLHVRTDPKFDRSGIIALQLHAGKPMAVRFKDIEIKELSPLVTGGSPSDERAVPSAPPVSKPPGPPAADRLLAGTVWSGSRSYRKGANGGNTATYSLHVRKREGKTFEGHVFDHGKKLNRSEIEGEVDGESITWRELTGASITSRGTVVGDTIWFNFTGNDGGGRTNEGDGKLTRDGDTGDPPAGKVGGFRPLFNGKDLSGWKVDRGEPNAWRVEDGHLVVDGSGDYRQQTFLLSEKNYSDFILRFEFFLPRGSDSGVAIRAEPGERPSPLEVNLRNVPDDPPGLHAETGAFRWSRSGGGMDYLKPDRSGPLRPVPAWNEMSIEVRDRSVEVVLNGQLVQDFDLEELSDRPNALPSLRRRSGRVGLQGHTGTVRFRNIQIKELDRR
jgi:hypothetical protein